MHVEKGPCEPRDVEMTGGYNYDRVNRADAPPQQGWMALGRFEGNPKP